MKKVRVDERKCLAYGVCVMTEPNVFILPDDADVAHIERAPVKDEEWMAIEEAVIACPASAISIMDEQ